MEGSREVLLATLHGGTYTGEANGSAICTKQAVGQGDLKAEDRAITSLKGISQKGSVVYNSKAYSSAEMEAASLLMGPIRETPVSTATGRGASKKGANAQAHAKATKVQLPIQKSRKATKRSRARPAGEQVYKMCTRKPLERFLPSDRKILSLILETTAYPSTALQETLARLLCTSRLRIRRWFEYQRYKVVKQDPNRHFPRTACTISDFNIAHLLKEREREVEMMEGWTDSTPPTDEALEALQPAQPAQPKEPVTKAAQVKQEKDNSDTEEEEMTIADEEPAGQEGVPRGILTFAPLQPFAPMPVKSEQPARSSGNALFQVPTMTAEALLSGGTPRTKPTLCDSD